MTQQDDWEYKAFLKEREEMQKRLQSLEPLPEKRHLRKDVVAYQVLTEAVQFFARGVFRWSIIACVSMLEYLLKKKVKGNDFNSLIENAEKAQLITKSDYHLLHGLRHNRNNLIHELGNNADEHLAKIVLLTSLKVFKTIVPIPIDNKWSFELFKQFIDDHYWDRLIDLDKFSYYISFKPMQSFDYWRFGVKFSTSPDLFTDKRNSSIEPLFHFTKEEQNNLIIHRYGTFKESHDSSTKIFLQNYKSEEIRFSVSKHEESVSLTFIFNETTAQHPALAGLHGFSFAKLVAWGNGAPFRFYVTVEEKEKYEVK